MNNEDLFIQNRKIIFSLKPERQIIKKILRFFMYFFGFCEIFVLLIINNNIMEVWEFVLGYSILNTSLVCLFYYLAKSTEKISIEVFDNGYMKEYASGFKYYIILLKNIHFMSPIRFKGQSSGYSFLDKDRNRLGFIQFAFFTSNQVTTLIEHIKKYNPSLVVEELKYFK